MNSKSICKSQMAEIPKNIWLYYAVAPYPTKDLESMEVMIKDMEKKRKANQKLKILSATRAMLKEFHRKLNEQLANLLQDDKFLWPELEVDSDLIKEQASKSRYFTECYSAFLCSPSLNSLIISQK